MTAQAPFRDLLYALDDPRLAMARGLDARQFGHAVRQIPIADELIRTWSDRLREPFHGITCNGNCQHGLFQLQDEGAPVRAMSTAARKLLAVLGAGEREKLRYPLDAPQWRAWSNPEFLVNDNGVRLEVLSDAARQAVMAVVACSFSTRGYAKSRDCMRTNAFLGGLVDLPLILNEWSYNFLLLGEPSETEPWGWSLYGHHLALNCFVLGGQMVVSPTFMGAEPNEIDTGPHAGTRLFVEEESVGLALMRSLEPGLCDRARSYRLLNDPAMPEGRWHPADQRHLAGAFQDNRVIPLEGVAASEFNRVQRDMLLRLMATFLEYLPATPLAHRMKQIEGHLDQTYWSWIGGHSEVDAFYYRIQSPVVLIEFDHHSGVWLNNGEPAKCHIHTVVRTPNGNDYGRDLLRQHYQQVHPGHAPGRD